MRYCVRPSEQPLSLPQEKSLPVVAQEHRWARAEEGSTPLLGGKTKRKLHLPVHVGPWPNDYPSMAEEYRARMDVDASDREQMPVGTFLAEEVFGMEGWDQRLQRQADRAKRQVRKVSPQTVVPGEEVVSILQSGRFEVEGTVSFNPLQPFDPNPTKDQYEGEDTPIAKEAIKFAYPRDASK